MEEPSLNSRTPGFPAEESFEQLGLIINTYVFIERHALIMKKWLDSWWISEDKSQCCAV